MRNRETPSREAAHGSFAVTGVWAVAWVVAWACCGYLQAINGAHAMPGKCYFCVHADDKSIRVWEWDIPVDTKYIADPTMHSMPAAAIHPNSTSLFLP